MGVMAEKRLFARISLACAAALAACSSGGSGGGFPLDGGGATGGAAGSAGSATGGAGAGATGGSAASGGAGTGASSGSSGAAGAPPCASGPNEDLDGDGFSIADGDCNDCMKQVNPGAIEIPNALDDDCDGSVDNLPQPCDGAIALDDSDPVTAARAIELCRLASGPTDWGLVSAKWTLPDGSPPPATNFDLGHGNLAAFGPSVAPQAGQRMLGLSSGTARQPSDPGYQSPSGFSKGYQSNAPAGYPKESPSCAGILTGAPYDGIMLELSVRAPTNAVAFSFDFKFYTFEWPTYICTEFNDFFLALLSPVPSGLTDGNVAFDGLNNLVSVNTGFLDVCACSAGPPCSAGGKSYPCSLGGADLGGTGFEEHAATGWLQTTVPVQAGEQITIGFTIYDSGDGLLDSSVLLDNWTWLTEGAPAAPITKKK
jgi:hypothetical protein